MAKDEHTLFIDKIPAYALGALDVDEISALQTHLQGCVSCRTELAEYRAISESLLTAVPPMQPPAALRKRLQSRLPGAQRKPRLKLAWDFGRLATGFAFIALLVLNFSSLMQIRQIRSQQAALLNRIKDSQVALALLSSPGVQLLPIGGGSVSGTLLFDEQNNRAVLIAQDLPMLGEDQTYQIWLVEDNGGRVSVGLFRPESGQFYTTKTISPTVFLNNYLGIGVTVEPAGGSDYPTGERILKVDF